MSNMRIESEQEKDRRLRQLLLSGVPRPDGWELPSPADPPAISVPAAVERAARDIAALKAARFESWGREPSGGYGIAAVPDRQDAWGQLTAWNRLEVLQLWIDWQGVSRKDRALLMSEQIDVRELPPGLGSPLTADAGLAERETSAGPFPRASDSPGRDRGRGR